jgi:hypothetical protein
MVITLPLLSLFVISWLLSVIGHVQAAECQSTENCLISTAPLNDDERLVLPFLATNELSSDIQYSGITFGQGIVIDQQETGLTYSVTVAAQNIESTLSDAIRDHEYISFTLTPNSNQPLNLAGSLFEIEIQRVDWHSPRNHSIMSSVDGFENGNEIFTSDRNPRLGSEFIEFRLPNNEHYRNINSATEIRLYTYGATYANHQARLVGFSLEKGLLANEELPSTTLPEVTSRQIMGTNLASLSDGSGAVEVTDLMKKSRRFITQDLVDRRSWDSELYEQMPKDENGYPLEVPFIVDGSPEQTVVTVMNNARTPVPAGQYLFTYDGEGEFSFIPQRSYQELSPGRGLLTVEQSNPQIQLTIKSSVSGNHLRNMKLLLPEYHEADENNLFTTDFLDSLRPFKVIRYLNWTKTNGSTVSSWQQRTTPTSQGQNHLDGVSAELIIALSNELKSDPWINIPHMADDQYIRELAKLYRDNLDPELNIYVEYSNEIWNTRFSQTRYAQEQGNLLGFNDIPGGSINNFYSYRTVQTIKIFEEVFAQRSEKVIGVMAGSLSSDWGVDMRLRYNWSTENVNHQQTGVDVVAIAPYFGNDISASENLVVLESWADNVETTGLDNLFDEIINGGRLANSNADVSPLQAMFLSMQKQSLIAERNKLPLIAYEGGQHLVVHYSSDRSRDNKIAELFFAANRDPRMGDVYKEIFNQWFAMNGGLFANFSHISSWSIWGSWGNIEYMGQPLAETPKHQAILETIVKLEEQSTTPSEDAINAILGTSEDDILDGDSANNHIQGLAGNDLIYASRGADIIDGGDGWDNLNFKNALGGIKVYLFSQSSKNSFGEVSQVLNIEGVFGSSFDDYLAGNDKSNYINGGAGNDAIRGRGGNNYLDGRDGDDIVILDLLQDDYTVTHENNKTILHGSTGINTLVNIESLQFADGSRISLDSFVNGDDTPTVPAPTPEPEPTPDPEPQPTPVPDPTPTPDPTPGRADQAVLHYIFGHSLIRHAPRLELPVEERNEASAETAVPYWMHKLVDSNENGHTYAITGQYGFLPQHADLEEDPGANWNFHRERNEPYAWTDWNTSFADADFTDVTITAANFIQHFAPDDNYEYPVWSYTTPLAETLKIVDWVNEQEPGIKVYIYENWGNMGTILNVPQDTAMHTITQNQLFDYHDFVQTEFHEWWVEYFALLQAARPDFELEMIPVGPIIAKLLNDDRFGLNSIQTHELYEDVAPHGRPTIYFIASLINYMAMYDERAPIDVEIPDTIHHLVKDNYAQIIEYIWQELQTHSN